MLVKDASERIYPGEFGGFSIFRDFYGTPDYERIAEKRVVGVKTGLQAGGIMGLGNIMLHPSVTFSNLVRHRKGLLFVLMGKGLITGAICGGVYSYAVSEISQARGKANDGWNHFYAGMVAYLPYALIYNKPYRVALYGMGVAGTVATFLKFGSGTDTVKKTYMDGVRTSDNPGRVHDLYMMVQIANHRAEFAQKEQERRQKQQLKN